MTDTVDTNQDEVIEPNELDLLKQRADTLGVKYHPSIGEDKLRSKLDEVLLTKPKQTITSEVALPTKLIPATEVEKRNRARKQAAKQIRVSVTCMNPNKKDHEGEILTVSNSVVGTHKKYVPFNGEPWHVPHIILKMLLDRKCQMFSTVVENGRKVRKGKLIPEFAVNILSPLSKKELSELARIQAMKTNQE